MSNQLCVSRSGHIEFMIAGAGRPVLYFHGTGTGNEVVVPFEQALVESGCQLIVPNRPGYFGTPLQGCESPSACAALAKELIDHLNIERVSVIGTSGGGPAAMRFATEYPDHTNRLVLQSAESHPWESAAWMPVDMQWLRPLFVSPLMRPALRACYQTVCQRRERQTSSFLRAYCGKDHNIVRSQESEQLVELLVQASSRCAREPAGIENDWDVFMGDPWLTPDAIECPTLIIHDEEDRIVPFAHAEWAMDSIPNAQLLKVGGGHLIWLADDADRMNARRIEFLHSGDDQP